MNEYISVWYGYVSLGVLPEVAKVLGLSNGQSVDEADLEANH